MNTIKQDYLAIILIGGGSSHGRASDKEEAIKHAIRYLRDWESLFQVSDIDVQINVVNVTGYDHVVWGADGLNGQPEGKGSDAPFEKIERPIETVTRHTPKWRKKRAA